MGFLVVSFLAVRDGPASWAHRIVGPFLRWRVRQTAIWTLEALNDYYLMDVGIERSDICSFVAKGGRKGKFSQ